MEQTSMNGKYYRTSMDDIKSSEGWFGKICLLGLLSFVPVFGQMTLYGYAYEWAHKAAWGVKDPLPKKIFGRPGSKMLRWGWFVLVIVFLFALIPSIISMIGSIMNSVGSPDTVYTGYGRRTVGSGNPALIAAGGLFSLVGSVLAIFTYVFAWVGCIRMTMYDRLGTGLQLGKVWKMAAHDFGGLMRILGMSLIFGIIFGIIAFVVCMGIVMIAVIPAVAGGMYVASNSSAALGYILTSMLVAAPFFLVLIYFLCVAQSFLTILIARAVGYWARQFDVASWGTKDDPLPFETQAAQQAQYQAPVQQPVAQQPVVQQQVAPQPAVVQQPVAQQPAVQQPAVQQATVQPQANMQVAEPAASDANAASVEPQADTPENGAGTQ